MSLGQGLCCQHAEGWGPSPAGGHRPEEGGRGERGPCTGSGAILRPPPCLPGPVHPQAILSFQRTAPSRVGGTPSYWGCTQKRFEGDSPTKLRTSSVILDKTCLTFWILGFLVFSPGIIVSSFQGSRGDQLGHVCPKALTLNMVCQRQFPYQRQHWVSTAGSLWPASLLLALTAFRMNRHPSEFPCSASPPCPEQGITELP